MGVVIIDCAIYRKGHREETSHDPAALADVIAGLAETDGFLWIGLYEPTLEELTQFAGPLNLHPLAVEDAVEAHQRPKVERYDDSPVHVHQDRHVHQRQHRDRRDQRVPRPAIPRHRPARAWARPAGGPTPGRERRARARARGHCRACTPSSTPWSTSTRTSPRSSRSTCRRSRSRCSRSDAPATRRASTGSSARRWSSGVPYPPARAGAALRPRRDARGRAALLPRHRRPPVASGGEHRQHRQASRQRPQRPPGPVEYPAERRHAEAHRGRRAVRHSHRDRRHLRHELRPHARAHLDVRLPARHRRDRRIDAYTYARFKKSGWL